MQETLQQNSRVLANKLLKDLHEKQNKKVQKNKNYQSSIDYLSFPNIQRTGKLISIQKYREMNQDGVRSMAQTTSNFNRQTKFQNMSNNMNQEKNRTYAGIFENSYMFQPSINKAAQTYSILAEKSQQFIDLMDHEVNEQLHRCVEQREQNRFIDLVNTKFKKIYEIFDQICERLKINQQNEIIEIIQICIQEINKSVEYSNEFLNQFKKDYQDLEKQSYDSQQINVNQIFIKMLDLILRMRNPFEQKQYLDELVQKNQQTMIDLKLKSNISRDKDSIYNSIILRAEQDKKNEVDLINRNYRGKQIFETDKINELFTMWEQNYKIDDKQEKKEQFEGLINYYSNEIQNYKDQIVHYESQAEKQNVAMQELQKLYDDLLLKESQVVTKQDVGLQLDLIYDKNQIRYDMRHTLERYLEHSIQNHMNDQNYSYESIDAMVCSLISDKAIQDYEFWVKKIHYKQMKVFVIEWFNSKFGNSSVARSHLNDFFKMCRQMQKRQVRCKIMLQMCGFHYQHPHMVGQINYNERTKQLFYESSECCRIIIQFSYIIKYLHNEFLDTKYPLIPSFIHEDNELYQVQVMQDVCQAIFMQEKVSQEVITQLDKDFQNLYNYDIQLRLQRQANKNKNVLNQTKSKNSGQDNRMIRFDIVLEFILENIANQRVKDVEQFVYHLKLQQNHRKVKDFSIDDFTNLIKKVYESKKTKEQISQAYSYFIQNSWTDDIQETIIRFIPFLIEPMQIMPHFYIDLSLQQYKLKPLVLNKKIKTNVKQTDYLTLDVQISESVFGDSEKLTLRKVFADPINQLTFIEEGYFICKDIIKNAEKIKEAVTNNHTQLRKELSQLPRKLYSVKNYDVSLASYDKEDLNKKVATINKIFRTLIDLTIQNQEK